MPARHAAAAVALHPQVRPGYVVGKAFAQANGVGGVAFSGLQFAFLQTCGTPAGTYPDTPAGRVFA